MIVSVIIEYNSKVYHEMIALRYRILREPLGLTFSVQDLEKDKDDILLGLSVSRPPRLGACCILSPADEDTVKLRQMAVDNDIQKSGLGKSMLSFAEYVAKEKSYTHIILHAREVAVGFYQKYGYKIVGDSFTEVGITHYRMKKQLDKE